MAGSRAFNFVSPLPSTNALGADCDPMGCTCRGSVRRFLLFEVHSLLHQLYRIVPFSSEASAYFSKTKTQQQKFISIWQILPALKTTGTYLMRC